MSPNVVDHEPFRRVLVASDLSSGADTSVQRACTLPLAAAAHITLVHALPFATPRTESRTESEARRALDALRAQALDLATQHGNPGVSIDCRFARGAPHDEIVKTAQSVDAQLVVIGRQGHKNIGASLLGSTAARVVRHADCPVLVVVGAVSGRYAQPLLATDCESASHRLVGITRAILGALPPPVTVTLAHVPDTGVVPIESNEAQAKLIAFIEQHRDAGFRMDPALVAGGVGWAVLHEAERIQADLIVMGIQRRGALLSAILGGVTDYVLTRTKCDVLVGRPH